MINYRVILVKEFKNSEEHNFPRNTNSMIMIFHGSW